MKTEMILLQINLQQAYGIIVNRNNKVYEIGFIIADISLRPSILDDFLEIPLNG